MCIRDSLNICRWGGVYAAIVSDKVQARIDIRGSLAQAMPNVKVLSFGEALGGETRHELMSASSLSPITLTGRAEEMASLIFTSGTTGRPKGVMLSHRNFTSLLSKMRGVFDVDKHDGLLSVLPLHHTFEFSAGLLMPLSRGAQIAYLPEVNADSLQMCIRDRSGRAPCWSHLGHSARSVDALSGESHG